MQYVLGKKNSAANRLSQHPPDKSKLLNKPLKNIKKFINTKLSAILCSVYLIKLAP